MINHGFDAEKSKMMGKLDGNIESTSVLKAVDSLDEDIQLKSPKGQDEVSSSQNRASTELQCGATSANEKLEGMQKGSGVDKVVPICSQNENNIPFDLTSWADHAWPTGFIKKNDTLDPLALQRNVSLEEHDKNILEDRDDSYESVKSSNSKKHCSAGKRTWDFEPEVSSRNKLSKVYENEPSCTKSFIKQASSFMNMIFAMTNGLSKSLELVTSMPQIKESSEEQKGDLVHIPSSGDKNKGVVTQSMNDFQYATQACCDPSLKNHDTSDDSVDETMLKEPTKPVSIGRNFVRLLDVAPLRTKMLDSDTKFKCPSQTLGNGSFSVRSLHTATYNTCTAFEGIQRELPGNRHNLITASTPCSSSHNVSGTRPLPIGSSILENGNICWYPESSWITRLIPKVNPPFHNFSLFEDNAALDNGVSAKDEKNSGTEKQDLISCGVFDCKIEQSDSFSPKCKDTDEIVKNNVDPVSSSKMLVNTETMASVFAKRLGAIKHLAPPNSSVEPLPTNATNCACLYCGKIGHILQGCPELPNSEADQFVGNLNLHGITDESSCICIRCFKNDHQAIACPNAPSKVMENGDPCASLVNNEKSSTKMNNVHHQVMDNFDQKLPLQSGDKVEFFPVEEADQEIVGLITKMEPIFSASVMNRTSKCLTQDLIKGNQKNLQKVVKPPQGLFKFIRRLHLPRAVISRLMKSPISNMCLAGFFLRLRLGKSEKDTGSTGYHVAIINGFTSKDRVSVNVGSFQCLVDCRFISNQNFREEDLISWWRAALEGDGKLPSKEELKNKLHERIKLGF